MNRKWTMALSVLAIGALVAACGSSSGDDSSSSSTIKVAVIPPTSGALAQYGTDAANAWKLAAKLANAKGGIDGHKIQIISKSTDATPATTLQQAREAVTQDGAKFIGAVMTSTEHGALNKQLTSLGALSFNSLGKDDTLVGAQCSPNAFHVVQTTTMDINALAASIAKMPGTKWAIQAVDYSTGHTSAEVFTKAAKAAGKQVVLTQYAPLNTTDFGSYITKLKDSGADALFAVEYGADGVAFVKQASQFKLNDQFKTVLGFNMVSDPLFKTLGDSVLGYYNNVGYNVNADNALNTAFVKAYTEAYGSRPYYVPADTYLAAETLFAGIDKANSTDPTKVIKALDGLTFDSIVGKVTMRGADHQLIRPSYLGQVVKDPAGPAGLGFKIVQEASGADITPAPSSACKM